MVYRKKNKRSFNKKLVTEFTWAANYTHMNERMGVISILYSILFLLNFI